MIIIRTEVAGAFRPPLWGEGCVDMTALSTAAGRPAGSAARTRTRTTARGWAPVYGGQEGAPLYRSVLYRSVRDTAHSINRGTVHSIEYSVCGPARAPRWRGTSTAGGTALPLAAATTTLAVRVQLQSGDAVSQ